MKKIFILWMLLLPALFARAQVQRVEYFIDTDPGYRKGIPVALGANNGSYDFTVNTGNLSGGMHTLYIRAQSNAGRWSQTMRRTFIMVVFSTTELSAVTYAEYFIDEDPGMKKGHAISLDSGSDTGDYSFTADVSDLPNGFHILYMRTLNKNGRWSQTMRRPFVKTVLPADLPADLAYIEYYIDTDPGQGKGKPITFTAGAQTVDFTADLTDIAAGSHTLKIRARNKAGKWEDIGMHSFTVITNTPTGVDDLEPIPVIAYPNPVSTTLFVKNDAMNITRIEIIDVSGKIVKVTGETSNAIITIPFQSYANGIYFVKMYTRTQCKTIKIVKN